MVMAADVALVATEMVVVTTTVYDDGDNRDIDDGGDSSDGGNGGSGDDGGDLISVGEQFHLIQRVTEEINRERRGKWREGGRGAVREKWRKEKTDEKGGRGGRTYGDSNLRFVTMAMVCDDDDVL
jgi:hypothetical protein